jgi:hypothetical protein
LFSKEYQAELEKVASSLKQQGVKFSSRMRFEEAEGAPAFLLGSFTIEIAKSVGPILGAVIGAWLHARYGRKARLKIGDVEAEARTVEEVEKLLRVADEKQKPRIVQP